MRQRTTGSIFVVAGLLVGAIGVAGEAGPAPVGHRGPDSLAEPAPAVCATGCAAARTGPPTLGAESFERLLALAAEAPLDEHNAAFEELLFHGERARALLEERGSEPLSGPDAARLQRELDRDEAWLAVRLVSLTGELRAELGPIAVPLGEKQHLFPEEAVGFVPPEISGTVRRVGVRHLWTRL